MVRLSKVRNSPNIERMGAYFLHNYLSHEGLCFQIPDFNIPILTASIYCVSTAYEREHSAVTAFKCMGQ